MSVPRILTVTKTLEVAAEQQGAVRDPALRAKRLRSAGPFVATGVPDVRRISIGRVVADAPGKRLPPALFHDVSPPAPRCATSPASGRSLIPFAASPCKVRNPWLPGLS